MLAIGRVVANMYCLDHFSFLLDVLESFNVHDVFEGYIAEGINIIRIPIKFMLIPYVKIFTFGIRRWDTLVMLCYINFHLHKILRPLIINLYLPNGQTYQKFLFKSIIQSRKPFELIHVDIWGPYHTPSMTGANYFMTLIDDFTRATCTYLMTYKSQTCVVLEKFVNLVQNQFNITIKIIISDNGSKFLSHSCQYLFAGLGILHNISCPYTPQQNEVRERKNRHLLQVTRALLFQSSLPTYFWEEALLYATFLITDYLHNCFRGKPLLKCSIINNQIMMRLRLLVV